MLPNQVRNKIQTTHSTPLHLTKELWSSQHNPPTASLPKKLIGVSKLGGVKLYINCSIILFLQRHLKALETEKFPFKLQRYCEPSTCANNVKVYVVASLDKSFHVSGDWSWSNWSLLGALLTRGWGLGETVSHKQCIPDSSTHGPKKRPGENFFLNPENLWDHI